MELHAVDVAAADGGHERPAVLGGREIAVAARRRREHPAKRLAAPDRAVRAALQLDFGEVAEQQVAEDEGEPVVLPGGAEGELPMPEVVGYKADLDEDEG